MKSENDGGSRNAQNPSPSMLSPQIAAAVVTMACRGRAGAAGRVRAPFNMVPPCGTPMAGLSLVEVLQPSPDLGVAQRPQAGPLQLAGALAGAAQQGADLLQGPGLARVQAEAQDQHLALARRQLGQGPVEGV